MLSLLPWLQTLTISSVLGEMGEIQTTLHLQDPYTKVHIQGVTEIKDVSP